MILRAETGSGATAIRTPSARCAASTRIASSDGLTTVAAERLEAGDQDLHHGTMLARAGRLVLPAKK